MSGIDDVKVHLLAADDSLDGFGLGQRADVIFRSCNTQEGASNVREVNSMPTKYDFTLHELILLVKLPDPLAERLTSEWYTIIFPLVHRQPGVHRFALHDAIPHGYIYVDVVGDGLEHAITSIDKGAWNDDHSRQFLTE
jgi:hypothetical protein